MLVFWKEKLVFLAVPKTGTTAFENALHTHADIAFRNPPGLKHAPIYRYNRFLKPLFGKVGAETLETVAVIREPIDWLGSWYRFRSRPQIDGTPESTKGLSFNDFVRGYIQSKQPPFARVGSQSRFVSDQAGNAVVSHLFRYDRLDEFQAFVQDRLNINVSLNKKTNVSPKAELTLLPGTEMRLRKKYARDFILWDSLA